MKMAISNDLLSGLIATATTGVIAITLSYLQIQSTESMFQTTIQSQKEALGKQNEQALRALESQFKNEKELLTFQLDKTRQTTLEIMERDQTSQNIAIQLEKKQKDIEYKQSIFNEFSKFIAEMLVDNHEIYMEIYKAALVTSLNREVALINGSEEAPHGFINNISGLNNIQIKEYNNSTAENFVLLGKVKQSFGDEIFSESIELAGIIAESRMGYINNYADIIESVQPYMNKKVKEVFKNLSLDEKTLESLPTNKDIVLISKELEESLLSIFVSEIQWDKVIVGYKEYFELQTKMIVNINSLKDKPIILSSN
jgi:hypothetical protein